MIWVGLLMAAGCLGLLWWAVNHGRNEGQARTMVFTCMAVYQLFHSLAIRSERYSLFRIGPASNPQLLGSVALVMVLQLLLVIWAPFGAIFKVEPIGAYDLALTLVIASSVFWAVELEKWLFRRGRIWQ